MKKEKDGKKNIFCAKIYRTPFYLALDMINAEEVHILDINSEYYGTPADALMENAGKGVYNFIKNELKAKEKNILVFCGKGNNGGDGLVATRHLSKNYSVKVFFIGEAKDIHTDISKKNYQKIKDLKIKIFDIDDLKKVDDLIKESQIIIDSMLGIGITGELREPYKEIVKKINNSKNKKIISVDIPTGLGSKNSIKPNYTVTFHDLKEKMNEKNCGKIKIVDIKIPKKAIDYVGPGELKILYPQPKKDSHKGENGRVLVVGGGPFIGAPALSGISCLRTGADLVFILTPKNPARAITSFSPKMIIPERLAEDLSKLSPNLIVQKLNHEDKLIPKDFEIIKDFFKKIDCLVIGPGLGTDPDTKKAVENIIKEFKKTKKPMVIDADAIEVVGKNKELIKNTKTVLTPHAGEFKKLTGVTLPENLEKRKKEVKKWAKKIGSTIILKGPIDVISDGKNIKLNDIHNQAMTVGGTGDVLTGIVGFFLSKKLSTFDSARTGVFINGMAGNNAFEKRSYGMIATDLIEEIPNILKKYL